MGNFVRQNVAASIVGTCAAAFTIWSMINEALRLYDAGLPNMVFAAIGAFIFFLAVVAILYRQHLSILESANPQGTATSNDAIEHLKATAQLEEVRRKQHKQDQLRDGIRGAQGVISFEPLNYEAWDHERYTLLDAAFLWADEQPQPETMFLAGDSLGYYKMLNEAVGKGEIDAWVLFAGSEKMKTRQPQPNHRVTRDDLKRLAKSRGMRPRFLFPEERDRRI